MSLVDICQHGYAKFELHLQSGLCDVDQAKLRRCRCNKTMVPLVMNETRCNFPIFVCVITSLGYIILKGGFSILKTIHFGKVLGRHLFGLVVVIKIVYELELIIHIVK